MVLAEKLGELVVEFNSVTSTQTKPSGSNGSLSIWKIRSFLNVPSSVTDETAKRMVWGPETTALVLIRYALLLSAAYPNGKGGRFLTSRDSILSSPGLKTLPYLTAT